jgi:hypothetical protein
VNVVASQADLHAKYGGVAGDCVVAAPSSLAPVAREARAG